MNPNACRVHTHAMSLFFSMATLFIDSLINLTHITFGRVETFKGGVGWRR